MSQFLEMVTSDHRRLPSLPLPGVEIRGADMKSRSRSLGELFNRIRYANSDTSSESPPSHHVLEMSSAVTTVDDSEKSQSLAFVLTFTDLCYSVKVSSKTSFLPRRFASTMAHEVEGTRTKTLLDNISGKAREGEIMAVLGASGSGKSTLIDALANRISRGSLRGSVTLNNESVDGKLMKVISAYVMQDDLLFPMLTVEETLMFSAELRLPSSISHDKKKERVQTLIDQLGLRSAAKTIIGDEGHRGVSGGERRRVSIGIDIIHDPILLFLDEPTSGLDSTSAFMVVKVLRRIAESGSVVVMSIHQPSYRILELLDRLIFLSRGQTVYSGSPGELRPFFTEFGCNVPESENHAEFALDLIRELEVSPNGTTSLVEFTKTWKLKNTGTDDSTSSSKDGKEASLKDVIRSRGKLVSEGATSMPEFANPIWKEMIVLSKRSFINSRRIPELVIVRFGAILVTGFILATIFWRLDTSPRGVRERIGFFAFAMSTTFYICAEALPVFIQERHIFIRETAYNAYRRSSYVLSNSIVALPGLVALSIAFATITFFAVGLAGGFSGYLFFLLTVVASFWVGNSFVTFISGFITHIMLGYVVIVATLAYFLLFSGFFIERSRIPIYWIWFHYISLVKYPYEGVLHNEFGDPTRCFVRGAQLFDGSPLDGVSDMVKERLLHAMSSSLGIDITMETCITTGPDILRQQGIVNLNKWDYVWITVAWGFLFRIIFYFSLLFGCKNKRR